MKKIYLIIPLLLLIAATFWVGSWYGQRAITLSPDVTRKVLYYVDPMNPAHTTDKPGLAPCGMPMVPVYADEDQSNAGLSLSPGTVKIGSEMQQLIGVRVSRVEKAPASRELRVLGWVIPDEERLYRVNALVDGWMEDVASVTTGSRVEKGQLLGTYGSADLFQFSQRMQFSIQAQRHLAPGQEPTALIDPVNSNFQQRVSDLRSLGMSPAQIEDFKETMVIPKDIKIYAPASGFVLARNISPGERFEKGKEWFQIAELSQVWVLADVPENEARYLQPGQSVKVTTAPRGGVFKARVSTVLPQFDAVTRTLKVRLQVENPDFTLKPNMYVNVEFSVNLEPSISVPMDAVRDTGTRKSIFVDRGDGYFEPREVKTGWRFGDRAEITQGLTEGERIVVSGNFLIDSESRMKLAAAGFYGEVMKDPVCGMSVDADKAATTGMKREYGGKNYYFCSEQCKTEFDKQPDKFAEKRAVEEVRDHEVHAVEVQPVQHHEAPPVEDHAGHNHGTPPAEDHSGHNHGTPPAADHAGHDHGTPPAADHAGHDHQAPAVLREAAMEHDAAKGIATDPVCRMTTPEEKSKSEGLLSEYQGKTYYFCSTDCKQKFDKDPVHYIKSDGASKSTADAPGGKEHRP